VNSWRVSTSCSISDTRRVNLVTNPLINHERGKYWICFHFDTNSNWSDNDKTVNTNYIVFGATRPGLEPRIDSTRGKHAYHYPIDPAPTIDHMRLTSRTLHGLCNSRSYIEIKMTYILHQTVNINIFICLLWCSGKISLILMSLHGFVIVRPIWVGISNINKKKGLPTWTPCCYKVIVCYK
jgi:hypothetical protein